MHCMVAQTWNMHDFIFIQDGINSYTCSCISGYTGPNCAINIDECADNPCLNGGICNVCIITPLIFNLWMLHIIQDGINSYSCLCPNGYYGLNCETVNDRCASSPCHNGANCTDTTNGFECSCLPGYTGTACETNVNDCAPNPCHNGVCSVR